MAAVAERGLDETSVAWQKIAEAMRQDGEGLLHSIEAAVSGATESTAQGLARLGGQIESASAAARNRLEAQAEEMGATLARLERANGSLGSLADALDKAQRQVSVLAERASGATATLDASATETLAAHRALVEESRAAQTAALESFSAATAALTDAVGRQVADQARAWQQSLDDFNAAGQAQRQQGERALASTQRTIDGLIESLGSAERGVAGLGRAAAGAATGAESRMTEIIETLDGLAQGAREQQAASLSAWQDAVSEFSEHAREHLAREMDAWRELIDGFNTSENAKRLTAETSRLAGLLSRLEGLLRLFGRNPRGDGR